MSPDTNPTPKKEYRKPQLKNPSDAQPEDARLMAILDLTLLLLDLKDLTRQLESAILKLSRAERLAAPRVAPVFRDRTRLSEAERAHLEQSAQRKLDDWNSVLHDRG